DVPGMEVTVEEPVLEQLTVERPHEARAHLAGSYFIRLTPTLDPRRVPFLDPQVVRHEDTLDELHDDDLLAAEAPMHLGHVDVVRLEVLPEAAQVRDLVAVVDLLTDDLLELFDHPVPRDVGDGGDALRHAEHERDELQVATQSRDVLQMKTEREPVDGHDQADGLEPCLLLDGDALDLGGLRGPNRRGRDEARVEHALSVERDAGQVGNPAERAAAQRVSVPSR